MSKNESEEEDRVCERCETRAAVYQRFGLNLCRRCFREIAPKMGFDKYE